MHDKSLYAGTTKEKGSVGESYVANFLIQKGFTILARNLHSRFGEIDIIAQKDDLITCVEVKSRKNPSFDLSALITLSKQKKIIATAKMFIAAHSLHSHTCRFDVAFVTIAPNNTPSLNYISHAFTDTMNL